MTLKVVWSNFKAMQVLKNSFLLTAGLILFLHTAVPHHHHSELDATEHYRQHEQAATLFDYLQLIFHIDLGADHLEHFNIASLLYIEPDLTDFKRHLTPVYALIKSTPLPVAALLPISQEIIRIHPFRGPPTLS
jgi:hypothetical protein